MELKRVTLASILIAMVSGMADLTLDAVNMQQSVYISQETYQEGACEINECLMHLKNGPFPVTRKLLRFDTRAANVGTTSFNLGAPSPRNPNFVWDECHRHYHFEEFAEYQVFSANDFAERFNLVPETGKRAFCLMDTAPTHLYTGPAHLQPQTQRHSCSFQGISVGWQDIYGANLDCQFVDITDLAPGDYKLLIRLNPSGYLNDSDPTNNEARLMFTIPGEGGDIIDPECNVRVPSWLGDGWCDTDGGYNTKECHWDHGDCCPDCCRSNGYDCGTNGYDCKNPTCMQLELACNVENQHWVGDGYCDRTGEYNTENCNYDGGDCCRECCTDGDYTCGQNGYQCQNPTCVQHNVAFNIIAP